MAPIDPHSYADDEQPRVVHADLRLTVQFSDKRFNGTVVLHLNDEPKGLLYLDTRDLEILAAKDGKGKAVQFSVNPSDSVMGSRLDLQLATNTVTIEFLTSPSASALQWLTPAQTAGRKLPYVFSQCQPIHARSIFPCHDTPQARITYITSLVIPSDCTAVMSATRTGRVENGSEAEESFSMKVPVPTYLFALAVGDIASKTISPVTSVFAEPSTVEAAASEFSAIPSMVSSAESLFGVYKWPSFNVLVMPPSFPYGGMENPTMTFLTPTVIVGDRSLVGVVAHELAHSWTGNLVTNATWEDFWLNEGWTVYAERRIQESLEGEEMVQLHAAIGWNDLETALTRFKDKPQFTKLKTNLKGVHPDEVFSEVPYEKGYLFLKRVEQAVGRPAFDSFIQKYIETFQFTSISTETFLAFLRDQLPEASQKVPVETWMHGTGLPEDAPKPSSQLLSSLEKRAEEVAGEGGRRLSAEETKGWTATEWQVFLGKLPRKMSAAKINALEEEFHFSVHPNWELKAGFLTIACNSSYESLYPAVKSSLASTGRMKFLKPLYTGLVAGGAKEFAVGVFKEYKDTYHVIAQQVISALLD